MSRFMLFNCKGIPYASVLYSLNNIFQRLAIKSIPLFMSQISSSPISIKTILIEALFDIFMKHDADMFGNHDNNVNPIFLTP